MSSISSVGGTPEDFGYDEDKQLVAAPPSSIASPIPQRVVDVDRLKLTSEDLAKAGAIAEQIIKSQYMSEHEAKRLAPFIVKAKKWTDLNHEGVKLRKSVTGMSYTFVAEGDAAYIHTQSVSARGGFKSVTRIFKIDFKTGQIQKVVHKKIRTDTPVAGHDVIGAGKAEVENQKQLSHPSIPRVLGFLEYTSSTGRSRLSIYEEACEATFETLLRENRLPFHKKAGLFKEVASGVAYMHQQGRLHNDLKLDNVMERNGRGMVIDFGLMSKIGETLPLSCQWILPPELVGKSKTAPRTTATDTFQFGLMLGQAFAPRGLSTITYQQTAGFVSVVKAAVQSWTPTNVHEKEMKTLVEACLSDDPASRPTMTHVRNTLDRLEKLTLLGSITPPDSPTLTASPPVLKGTYVDD